ncbi:MAG: DUF4287 domain-containing protein [Actinomycetales bacterium]|nr:DUF4287 domain-containing protein [Actinomycetales bacterium]
MATSSGDREAYWPAIEKKHGLPMSHWFDVMAEISDRKYPEQIAYLRENHGFSQAHANALVMYTRGSKSSRRFTSVDDYLAPLDEQKRATVTSILSAAKAASPGSEVVIAWNKPMVRLGGQYLLGVDVATHHVLLLPLSADVIDRFRDRLAAYPRKKKTVQVPVDWKVDKRLVADLVSARLAELD